MSKKLSKEIKALRMIEMLCAEEAESISYQHSERTKNFLGQIYEIAHVGVGSCENPHLDWVKRFEETYKAMKDSDLI